MLALTDIDPQIQTENDDNDDNNNNNDYLFALSLSHSTTPLDSTYDDTDNGQVVYSLSSGDSDSDNPNATIKRPAESAEAELSTRTSHVQQYTTYLIYLDCLAKDWVSPIYVFFNHLPWIKYVDSHQVHMLKCAASHCKGKHSPDVCRFLNTGNVKLTSSLCQHTKNVLG